VADMNNHRVMRWCKGAKEGTIVVGGNGKGKQSNQFNGPVGLSFDRQGNLYVADYWNRRIQKFEIN
jgi:sugar lactone lactonase YvrE